MKMNVFLYYDVSKYATHTCTAITSIHMHTYFAEASPPHTFLVEKKRCIYFSIKLPIIRSETSAMTSF